MDQHLYHCLLYSLLESQNSQLQSTNQGTILDNTPLIIGSLKFNKKVLVHQSGVTSYS